MKIKRPQRPRILKIKKLIALAPEPLARLEHLKTTKRRTYTQILEDLIMGRDRFAPDVEAWLASEVARLNLPPDVVIERALLRVMSGMPKAEGKLAQAIARAAAMEVTDAEAQAIKDVIESMPEVETHRKHRRHA